MKRIGLIGVGALVAGFVVTVCGFTSVSSHSTPGLVDEINTALTQVERGTNITGNIPLAAVSNALNTTGANTIPAAAINGNVAVADVSNALWTGAANIGPGITYASISNTLQGNVALSALAANSVDSSKIVAGTIVGADVSTGAVLNVDQAIAVADVKGPKFTIGSDGYLTVISWIGTNALVFITADLANTNVLDLISVPTTP